MNPSKVLRLSPEMEMYVFGTESNRYIREVGIVNCFHVNRNWGNSFMFCTELIAIFKIYHGVFLLRVIQTSTRKLVIHVYTTECQKGYLFKHKICLIKLEC